MTAKNIYDLNDNCLISIFDYLDINELMNLCVTTKCFRKIVVDIVVPRRRIEVAGPSVNHTMNEVFRMFGKTMRKVKFDGKEYTFQGRTRGRIGEVFEIFLQILLDYCEPGLLKEVHIRNINKEIQNRPIDPVLLTRCAPYFKNVTTLEIEFHCNYKCTMPMEQWLASIQDNQIQKLWFGLERPGDYIFTLDPNSFTNVQHLGLYTYEYRAKTNLDGLTEFIRRKSHLKTVSIVGFEANTVLKTVANEFPNIETVGDIDLDSNPGEIDLGQLKSLKAISIEGKFRNYLKESDKILEALASRAALKTLWICTDFRDKVEISNKVLSFKKSNDQGRKICLEYLDICVPIMCNNSSVEMCLNYMFGNIHNAFIVKTLRYHGPINNIHSIISAAVRALSCLENVITDIELYAEEKVYDDNEVDIWIECYKKLISEKIIANKTMESSKRLVIYVEGDIADKCRAELGSDYDLKAITLESTSMCTKRYKLW